MGSDRFNLQRFVEAHEHVYGSVLRELRSGHKHGHWMWYIFPQIRGLGRSVTSQKYAISCQEEAMAYLEHAILGSRLKECTQLVVNVEGRSAEQIFHYPDDLKFRSCMTLFAQASADPNIFWTALDKYFLGERDVTTLALLGKQESLP